MGWVVWGSHPSGAKIFRIHPSRPVLAPTQVLCNGQWVSALGVKWLNMSFTTHLYLAPSLKKEYS